MIEPENRGFKFPGRLINGELTEEQRRKLTVSDDAARYLFNWKGGESEWHYIIRKTVSRFITATVEKFYRILKRRLWW
jgi:hypothetical protein